MDDSLFLCDQSGEYALSGCKAEPNLAETKSKCEFEMLRCVYRIKYGYNITPAYVSCPLTKAVCPRCLKFSRVLSGGQVLS